MNIISVSDSGSSLGSISDYEVTSVDIISGDKWNGEAKMCVWMNNEEYTLRVSLKEGKKEGKGLLLRENGTLFLKLTFVNDLVDGEMLEMDRQGNTVLRGSMKQGQEDGFFREFNTDGNEIWRGLYRNGKRYSVLKECEGMKGFYSEVNMNGDLVSVSEYDDGGLLKNGRCFEVERGYLKRECVYEHGMKKRVLREWNDKGMIEYGMTGMRVYEGGFVGDMKNGFVREGKGKEFGDDGKSALYVGEWKNGLRDGEGSELDDGREMIRRGRWIEGEHDTIKYNQMTRTE